MLFPCFATTSKGLESLLATELEELGAESCVAFNAGIGFKASLNSIMKINLNSRLASRVMLQVGFGGYRNEDDIYHIANKVNWSDWFHVGNSIKIATTAINSPLKSLEFITLKVKDAICDYYQSALDTRPNVNKQNPDVRIYNFLTKDTITIYLDTSGEALFKRGYRHHQLEAPLKENLAAGLIQLTNWDKHIPFYDPMCGGGTIITEAISYGLNIAPGLNRYFGFEKLEQFDLDYFEKLKITATSRIDYNAPLKIYAGDISKRAISAMRDNINASGLLKYVKADVSDFLDKKAPEETGILLCNPPYGIRIDEQDNLAHLYPLIGNNLKQNFANWDCYFFSADLRLGKLIRLKPNRKIPLYNGALECRLFEFKMVSGFNR